MNLDTLSSMERRAILALVLVGGLVCGGCQTTRQAWICTGVGVGMVGVGGGLRGNATVSERDDAHHGAGVGCFGARTGSALNSGSYIVHIESYCARVSRSSLSRVPHTSRICWMPSHIMSTPVASSV
jgi:hypothetical protein